MIDEAVRHLDCSRYGSPFRSILVDEFQDLSVARAHLLRALLRSHPDATLFGVGDDWQSIDRFTGSNIMLTTRFQDHFGRARVVALDRTFRFTNQLCDFAASFVRQNAAQLQKPLHTADTADSPAVTLVQHEPRTNAAAIAQCLDDIQRRAQGRASVYFIGRCRASRPTELQASHRRFPGLTCRDDTAHKRQGQKADDVIVLDVNDGRRSWPSKIEDDPHSGSYDRTKNPIRSPKRGGCSLSP